MKGNVGRHDEEHIKAAWDWAVETGQSHGLAIRLCFVPAGRRGVWAVRAQAVEVVDGRAIKILNQHEQEWPNASYSTLAGAVFAALMALDNRLGEPEKRAADPV